MTTRSNSISQVINHIHYLQRKSIAISSWVEWDPYTGMTA